MGEGHRVKYANLLAWNMKESRQMPRNGNILYKVEKAKCLSRNHQKEKINHCILDLDSVTSIFEILSNLYSDK